MEEKPPVLKTWNQLYLAVLLLNALLFALFYLFTAHYN